jgi:hypothetical protein
MIVAGLLWHHFVLSRRPGGWTPQVESIAAVPPA